MRRLILSFFGAGLLRPAPGTWGSLAALAGFSLALLRLKLRAYEEIR